jgi:hypothetical protein
MKLRYGIVLMAGTASVLLAGCSGGGSDASGVASVSGAPTSSAPAPKADSGPGDDQAQLSAMVAFAGCMRKNGVNMPDPTSAGARISIPEGLSKDAMDKAQEACKKFLPNGGAAQDPTAMLQHAVKIAKCLRDHGVDVADPTAAQPSLNLPNPNDPKAAAAMKACGISL